MSKGRIIIGAALILAGAAAFGIKDNPAPKAQPIKIVECIEEDGSTPGQPFPCRFAGSANGSGYDFILTGPLDQTDPLRIGASSNN